MRCFTLFIGLAAFTLCAPVHVQAQITFERTYGGQFFDAASEVLETSDHGFLILGTTRSFSNDTTDAWLIRTDARGDTLWTRILGGDDHDSGTSMAPAPDGGYLLGVSSKSIVPGNYEILLVKVDEEGRTQWSKTYGGPEDEYVHSIRPTQDGGYIVFAYTTSYGAGSRDFYLIKLNATGDSLWARTYGGAGLDLGSEVQQTADGGFILAGYAESFQDPEGDVYLIRTDAAGDTLWTRTYGEAGYDRAYHVLITRDGGFLVVGVTSSLGAATQNGWLIKTDAQGAVQWTTVYGAEKRCHFTHAVQLADGDYIVAGGGASETSDVSDAYLLRFDNDGDPVWIRYFGGEKQDGASWVLETTDGGFAVVGQTESAAPDRYYDLYFIKTDGDGMLTEIPSQRSLPSSCVLHQNYPNPFRPTTTIRYVLPRAMRTSLLVTDALGREVWKADGWKLEEQGEHSITFDARGFLSGVYLYRLMTEDAVLVRKMVVMK